MHTQTSDQDFLKQFVFLKEYINLFLIFGAKIVKQDFVGFSACEWLFTKLSGRGFKSLLILIQLLPFLYGEN